VLALHGPESSPDRDPRTFLRLRFLWTESRASRAAARSKQSQDGIDHTPITVRLRHWVTAKLIE
jgi:hypothetical protein